MVPKQISGTSKLPEEKVLTILEGGSQNAYEVATQMKWDMSYERWDQFSTPQKWFATGEAISHLRYLEVKGSLKRVTVNGKITYQLV
ncbi:hypothetical protein [Syntrophomonas erecta]